MSRRSIDPVTGLTPQQESFCLELALSGNASEAYRRAYNAEKMKPETIARRAADLVANGKIAARLENLRFDARERSGITLAEHLATLRLLREEARKVGQLSAAITAETNRGKASGLYVERTEISGPNGGPIETVDAKEKLLGRLSR